MDPQAILALYDREMRLDAPAERGTLYRKLGLTFFTSLPPGPPEGWVIYTRLDDDTIDDEIRAMIDFYQQKGARFEWKVYDHDTPPNLKERLLEHGFVPEELEALMVMDVDALPKTFWEPITADVRRIDDAVNLADVTAIEMVVWGEPFDDLHEMLTADLQEMPDKLSVYVAYGDGQPASSAWVYYHPDRQFGELFGGATIPAWRGKGLYTALVKARAREARERGVRYLAVDASPMSRPILEKMGFTLLTFTQPFVMDFSKR